MRGIHNIAPSQIGSVDNNRWKAPVHEMPNSMLITAMRESSTEEDAFVFFRKYGRPALTGNAKNRALLADTLFAVWLKKWDEVVKLKKTKMFQEHNAAGAKVLQLIAMKLQIYLATTEQEECLYFYGTLAMQKNHEIRKYEKWAGFADQLFTIDIDLSSSNPFNTTDLALNFLFDLAETTVFKSLDNDDHLVYRISHVYASLKDTFYTIHVDVKVDDPDENIPFAYLVCRSGIADITPLQINNAVVTKAEKITWQTPSNYICGLVDKLFNTQLNPRINKEQRPYSAKKVKEKLKRLYIPKLTLDEENEIRTHSLLPEFTALSNIDFAQDCLRYLLENNVDKAIEFSFEQFVTSLKE